VHVLLAFLDAASIPDARYSTSLPSSLPGSDVLLIVVCSETVALPLRQMAYSMAIWYQRCCARPVAYS
jgi:hypothetical protein